jgi:hypothetical protein
MSLVLAESRMDALITAVVALVGFGGVLLGAWLTERQQQAQRRAEFLEHQLRDFYSPLLALHDQTLAKKRMREKVFQVAQKDPRVKREQFDQLAQHDAEHFVEELFPDYEKMLTVFRDNLWLADAETQSYFPDFFEFVEIWRKWLKGTLPTMMVPAYGHSEEPLQPFYEHLRRKLEELQTKLSHGKV